MMFKEAKQAVDARRGGFDDLWRLYASALTLKLWAATQNPDFKRHYELSSEGLGWFNFRDVFLEFALIEIGEAVEAKLNP